MKSGLLAIAALLAAGTANAGAPVAPIVTIKGSGTGNWEVLCHVTSPGGDETIRALGHDRTTLALTSLRYATCNYKNSSKVPLTISIESSTFACPFKAAAETACEAQFTPGAFGSIELRRKS